MGKRSVDREAKKGSLDPIKLPPMQALNSFPEVITIADSPGIESKKKLRKYVSPLSLTWKRKSPIADKLPESSPAKVASDCQATEASFRIISLTGVAPTAQVATTTSLKSSESEEQEFVEGGAKCSRLSEGAFNISRIAVTSTPVGPKKPAIDNANFNKPNSGENKLEKELNTKPIVDSEATTIPRKNKKSKKKNQHQNIDEASPANNVGHSSSCIILAENFQPKEQKETVEMHTLTPQENTNVKQRPCEIETIDLDMTNEITNNIDKGIEVLAIKKISKIPVEIVDLSCTLDAVVSAPKTDTSVIVIDDDDPNEIQRNKQRAKEKRKNKKDKFLQLQPHPSLKKKKERRRKRDKKLATMAPLISSALGDDDVYFLGTGISWRAPKKTAINKRGVSQPSASAGSSSQNQEPTAIPPSSIYGSNFDNPNSNVPQTGLRPIVIDGSNVAMGHGRRENVFSSKGIEICVNYFLKRGHKVYCFIPQYRKSDPFTKDRQILTELEAQGHLICTPSRYIGSNAIVPYDDRYIVQIAAELGGVIISRDNYRDLVEENPAFKETIQSRTLMFTWVGDILMFPNDPFGRCNVSLDRMLRF